MTGPVTVAFRPTEAANGAKTETFADAGTNPPEGVIIHYYLKEKPAGAVKLQILNADGNEIRSFTVKKERAAGDEAASDSPAAEIQVATGEEEVSIEEEPQGEELSLPVAAGMNRFVWDYRYPKPAKVVDRTGTARQEMMEANVAPKAVPGKYQMRLTVGDQTYTESFAILPDPRLPVSAKDLQAQFDLKLAIRDRLSEVNQSLNQIQRVRSQVEEWEKRAKGTDHAARIASAGKTLREQLKTIEGTLINLDADKPQPGVSRIKEKLGALSTMIDESDHVPTKGAGEVYTMLHDQLDEQRKELQQLLDEHIPSFGDLVQSLAIPPIVA
jgi:hypothetical protein